MTFAETRVDGCWVIAPSLRADARGFFARMWDREAFATHGLSTDFVQANNSACRHRGTLRGLHWQTASAPEAKLVRCVAGRVFDVVADTRVGSPTFGAWTGMVLSAAERQMVYVPPECAHGYLALDDDAEVIYAVTGRYAPDAERGMRWNDPAFGIAWPDVGELLLSEKDQAWPDFPGADPEEPR